MGSGGKERLKKEPSHFFQPHSEFKSVTTGLGMVSLSAGAVFLTHPSEVREDQAGQGEGEQCGQSYGSERGSYAWLFLGSVL